MVKITFAAVVAGLAANVAAVPHFRATGNVTAYPTGTAVPSLVPWKTSNSTVPQPTGTGVPSIFPYIKAASLAVANVPATESSLNADGFSSLASEITSLTSSGGSVDSIADVLQSFLGNNTIPTSVTSDTSLSSVLSVVQDVVKIVEAVVSQVGDLGSIIGLKEKRFESSPADKRQLSALITLGTALFKIVTSVISLAGSAISSGAVSTIIEEIIAAVKALISVVSGLGLGI